MMYTINTGEIDIFSPSILLSQSFVTGLLTAWVVFFLSLLCTTQKTASRIDASAGLILVSMNLKILVPWGLWHPGQFAVMPRNLIYVAFYLLLSKRTHFSTSVNSQIDWTTGLVYLNSYLARQALYSLGITVEHPYVNFLSGCSLNARASLCANTDDTLSINLGPFSAQRSNSQRTSTNTSIHLPTPIDKVCSPASCWECWFMRLTEGHTLYHG